MERRRISISFVGVFEKPQNTINLDNKFCRDLFGLPYETINGLGPEGYIIRLNNKPFPLVLLNSNKIIFKAAEEDKLDEYISKFVDKIINANFTAYGINYEYEWTGLKGFSQEWIWNHFFRKDLKTPSPYHISSSIKFSLGLNENELANIEIQPRFDNPNAIFASINHHHQVTLSGFPSKQELHDLIANSENQLKQKIFNTLIENKDA